MNTDNSENNEKNPSIRTMSQDYNIMKIYSQAETEDMGQFDKKPKKKRGVIIFLFFLFLSLIAGFSWFGYQFFGGAKDFKQENLVLTIEGPKNISSGDKLKYTVSYENRNDDPVTDAELIIDYPNNFTIEKTNPEASNAIKNHWSIGPINGKSNGKVEFEGTMVGSVDDVPQFKATLSYKPINFNSEFSSNATYDAKIMNSALTINLSGPSQIKPGDKITYKINYGDFTHLALASNVQIKLIYPDDFVFQEAKPSADLGQDIWSSKVLSDNLKNAGEGVIEITGIYNAKTTLEKQNFKAQIGFLDSKNNYKVEQEVTAETTMSKGDLTLELNINNSSQGQPVNFGDKLNYAINFKRLSNKPVVINYLKLAIKSDLIDWTTLQDSNQGKLNNGELTWTSNEVSSLSNSTASINFSVNIKDAQSIEEMQIPIEQLKNLKVESFASAEVEVVDQDGADAKPSTIVIKSGTIANLLNTDLIFKSQARYFDDNNIAVGTGPLPPKINQTTTYNVVWSVQNSLHEVSDLVVTTRLAPGVNWTDKKDLGAGIINYDPDSRQIVWKINKLPVNSKPLITRFELSITPDNSKLNQIMALTNESTVEAKDKVTGAVIKINKPALTTDLTDDSMANNKGIIGQ